MRTAARVLDRGADARGQTLLSRTRQPGESLGLDGEVPLRVTIGNAAATQITFRGQPVDLAPPRATTWPGWS